MRKRFFFEKKKQKTFVSLGLGRCNRAGTEESEVFCAAPRGGAFFQKSAASFRLTKM